MDYLWNTLTVAALIFGFGFVVFFHELGHFLAAKLVGIKVEQFAVGFGHAVASWRKGLGWTMGSSGKTLADMEKSGRDISHLGETEYRLNWIPLGGYVKMLGQDDLNPNAVAEDPRAYNKKSIGARMFVVSAGVLMNVLLAGLLFMGLFLLGFRVQPAIVGSMLTHSPAQKAGLQSGDRILTLGGSRQHDFNNLSLNVVLAPAGQDIPMTVWRNGQIKELTVRPEKASGDAGAFFVLGIELPHHLRPLDLRGLDPKGAKTLQKEGISLDPATNVLPGELITRVNGTEVGVTDYPVLVQAIQQSFGRPIELTVQQADRGTRAVSVQPRFEFFFGDVPVNVAGMELVPQIDFVQPESPARDHLKKGDVVVELWVGNDKLTHPSPRELVENLKRAGENGHEVALTVVRGGQRLSKTPPMIPSINVGGGKKGLGISLGAAGKHPAISAVIENSPAHRAGMPKGALVTTVNGHPVSSWFDVHRILAAGNGKYNFTLTKENNPEPIAVALELSHDELVQVQRIRYRHELLLAEHIEPRQTSNPVEAAWWGVIETRDMLLQFYMTLHRLFQGSVGVSNLMGPIGIVHTGSAIAFKGSDWLIWFLAMISANLAVVNFLPIPIVDGGLFVFLIVEKIQGKPLSPRMQTVAQLVGFAIILSVFVLVTYQDIAAPSPARMSDRMLPTVHAAGHSGSPRRRRCIARACWIGAVTFTSTPMSTSPTPNHSDRPPSCGTSITSCAAATSLRNNPNRATTNPNPISASPVLIHANNVRSAA